MAKKFSIYLGERADEIIGALPENGRVSLSGRVNSILDRYGEIIARTDVLNQFTADELLMIKMCNWTTVTNGELAGLLLGGIEANLVDSQDFELMEFDRAAVEVCIAKVAVLTPAEQFALIEWIENEREHA